MDKYLVKVKDLLAQNGLSVDDVTKDELADMIEETKDLDNPNVVILDGYFGSPMAIFNIKSRKSLLAHYIGSKKVSDFTDEELDEFMKTIPSN